MKKLGLFLLVLLMLVSLFPKTASAAEATTFDQDLTTYLEEVSAIRGYDVNAEDINESLSAYDLSTSDFSNVDELKSFLGDVIKSDLSNLSSIYEAYDLDQTTLTQKLSEYGEDVNDYIYLYDLENALNVFASGENTSSGISQAMVLEMLKQFDLSDSEMQKMQEYYLSNQDYLGSDEVKNKLDDLQTRMMATVNTLMEKRTTDENYKPTDSEITDISSMYDELFSILKLKVELSLNKDGVDTPTSLFELMKLDSVDSADVKVLIYNSDSELLVDMIIPNDMLGSKIEEVVKEVSKATDNKTVHTQKGGTLPKTASNYTGFSLLGLFVATAGAFIYRRIRKDQIEAYQNQK